MTSKKEPASRQLKEDYDNSKENSSIEDDGKKVTMFARPKDGKVHPMNFGGMNQDYYKGGIDILTNGNIDMTGGP